MRWRVILLVVLFILRLVPNWIEGVRVKKESAVKITGKVDIHNQSISICRGTIGNYWFELTDNCRFSQGETISLVGRVRQKVTDRLLGRFWLDVGAFIPIEKKGIAVEKEEVGVGRIFLAIREKMSLVFKRILPEPEASLTAGIVLGIKSGLNTELYQNLIKTGTVHVVVASGYNVLVVGGMVLAVSLFWFKRRQATVAAILGMLFYGSLAGWQPPVTRAVLMGATLFLSLAWGRANSGWWSLTLSVFLMLWLDPLMLVNISFQLSVAASVGLLILSPKLERALPAVLAPSFSAWLTTLPVIWWHFERVSWIAPLVNSLIAPLVPLLMTTGGVMLILGIVWQPLAQLAVWPVYSLANLLIVIINIFS
ncbi:ComEC/Rec2 family competence protein [Candidatus Collierbacteria bacterium]|nr:ComEC/Rec2 family competence protein [Candidatus Collierbacteria bacterium]